MGDRVFNSNGRLVADFDKIYSEEKDPWGQGDNFGKYGEYNYWARQRLQRLLMMWKGNVTEVGCGAGHALNFISDNNEDRFRGVDISKTAIELAQKNYPKLKFEVANVLKEKVVDDIIVINETLWYLLPDLKIALDNCVCSYLVINHGFLKEQRFYKDVLNGWSGLLKWLIDNNYTIISAEYQHSEEPLMNGLVLCTRS